MDFFVEFNGNKLKNKMLDEINKVIKQVEEVELDIEKDYFSIKIYDKEAIKYIKDIIEKSKKGK